MNKRCKRKVVDIKIKSNTEKTGKINRENGGGVVVKG